MSKLIKGNMPNKLLLLAEVKSEHLLKTICSKNVANYFIMIYIKLIAQFSSAEN